MRGLIENSLSTSSVLSDDTAFKLGILTTRIISAELVLKMFSCLNRENISCIFPPFEMGDVSKCIWRATGTNADGSAGHKKRDSPIPPSPARSTTLYSVSRQLSVVQFPDSRAVPPDMHHKSAASLAGHPVRVPSDTLFFLSLSSKVIPKSQNLQ